MMSAMIEALQPDNDYGTLDLLCRKCGGSVIIKDLQRIDDNEYPGGNIVTVLFHCYGCGTKWGTGKRVDGDYN